MEEADDAGFLEELDRASFDVPSVADHPQNQYRDGFMPIVRLIADMWARLAQRTPDQARAFALAWGVSGFILLRRLHLHAAAEPIVFGADEAAAVLRGLDDEAFWSDDLRRESMRLMAERWEAFGEAERDALAARIGAGIPRSLFPEDAFEGEAEWEAVRDRSVFVRLARIDAMGGALNAASRAVLEKVRRHPAWVPGPGDRDDFRSWFSTSHGPQGDPTALAGVPDAGLVKEAARLQAERRLEQGDIWHVLCKADPERALRGLALDAEAGRWNIGAWRSLFSAASTTERADLQRAIASLVLRMPAGELTTLAGAIVAWMLEGRAQFSEGEAHPSGLFLSVWDRVAEAVYGAAEAIGPLLGERDIEFEALNRPGGMLASVLCEALGAARPEAGAGLGERLGPRFALAIGAGGRSGLLARVRFARHLPWLHRIAPAWTAEALLPRLAVEDAEADALWGGAAKRRRSAASGAV